MAEVRIGKQVFTVLPGKRAPLITEPGFTVTWTGEAMLVTLGVVSGLSGFSATVAPQMKFATAFTAAINRVDGAREAALQAMLRVGAADIEPAAPKRPVPVPVKAKPKAAATKRPVPVPVKAKSKAARPVPVPVKAKSKAASKSAKKR
jgi:hypothetical protein